MEQSFTSFSVERTVSNLLLPVSRRQFLRLADAFKASADDTLGSCKMELEVLGGKEHASQLKTGDLTQLTKAAWKSGDQFKLTFTPASGGTASAELTKGAKQMTYKAAKRSA